MIKNVNLAISIQYIVVNSEVFMYNHIIRIVLLLFICILCTSCYKTITETKIEYILPEIPEAIISPCDTIHVNTSITTNGDLLMAYISLQSSYIICASKITSIANILQSYNSIYTVAPVEDSDKSE